MAYVLRRLGVAIGLIWLVATLIFLVLRLIPGDPAELLLSSGGVAPDPAAVAELRERLGLERPLLEQYVAFLGRLARGDLGNSLPDDCPVVDEIARRLPRTLELIVAATLLAVLDRPAARRVRRAAPRRRVRPRAVGRRELLPVGAGVRASARCWCCCSRRSCAGCRPAATSPSRRTRGRTGHPADAGGRPSRSGSLPWCSA